MRKELVKIVTFAGVGGIATLVHLIVCLALATISHINPFVINLMAFTMAVPISFWGNSRLTFRKNGSKLGFFTLSLSGFFLNNIILSSLYLNTHIKPALMLTCAALLTSILTYLGARLFIFK
jgi:putative flippase GtrA